MPERLWQQAGALTALLAVAGSYLVASVYQGDSSLPQSLLGYLIILQYGLLSLGMFTIWWYRGSTIRSLWDYRWLLVAAVGLRLLLLPIEPYLSNDIDRYMFDGYLAWSGFDPYVISHDDPALIELRALWQPPPEHAAYTTLYPPLALMLYALAASSGPEWAWWVWNLMVCLAGIALVWVTALVLRGYNCLQHLPLVALSPLLIFETGIGGHVDIFTALLIAVSILCWQRNNMALAGFFIGLGVLIKFLPGCLLLPFLLAQHSGNKPRLILLASASISVIIGYSLAFAMGLTPLGSLGVFFEKWRFGAPVFSVMQALLPENYLLTTVAIAGMVGYGLIALWLWQNLDTKPDNLWLAAQLSLALPLLLSPVMFPWYALPLVLLIALRPSLPAMIWLTLLPLTYEVYGQFVCCNQWLPAHWPLWFISIGSLVALFISQVQAKTHITWQKILRAN